MPAKPGVPVPQIVIDRARQDGDMFYPRPMLAERMARYAAAKRAAAQQGLPLDEVDDIYGYSPVVCGLYADSGPAPWNVSLLQQELFNGPWQTRTMTEYYEEISYNQFHLDGSVYGWYTSQLTQAEVVGSYYGLGPDARVGEFIVDLLIDCDPATNFGQYDNDGPDNIPNSGDDDGMVDALFVVHDGPGGEIGANNIWSHSWSLLWAYGSYFQTNDPRTGGGNIFIGPYIIQPAVNGSGGIIEIGVFCHEFGHALGLPDLYDTDYSSSGIGDWCLMSGGSWNTVTSPAHMIAWCRYKLGWIQPTEIATYLHDQPVVAIETSGQAFKLWTEGYYDAEYFMVENRQRIGSDVHLPGEGLAIWHVDENGDQTNEWHPLVDMEEADGLQQLNYGSNSGDAGDVFPGSTSNLWFDEYTNPSSLDYSLLPTQVAVWNIPPQPSDTMIVNLDVIYSQPFLVFQDHVIVDAMGNGDGRADPGETVDLYVVLENLWASTSTLTAILSQNPILVQMLDSTGAWGLLPHQGTGSNAANPFRFFVPDGAGQGSWVNFSMALTDNTGITQIMEFSVQIGRAPMLLVDDDQGLNFETYLQSSLEEADELFETWHVDEQGSPASDLSIYQTVIWMTGNDSLSTLSGTEMSALQAFIESGKTVIITGQGINEDIGSSNFFMNYLRCTPRTGDVNQPMLYGDSTNTISSGMQMLLIGSGGANNQTSPSSVYPAGSQSLLVYPNGQVGGVNYIHETSGAHVVYLAFGLESVSGLSSTTSRTAFLNAIFDWVEASGIFETGNGVSSTPQNFRLHSAFPNPFNPATTIRYDLPMASYVTLEVFDISGRHIGQALGGFGLPSHQWQAAGSHEIILNGAGQASGIYLFRLSAGEYAATDKMVLMK
jgi:M6 family metalloprotease-like protein